MQPQQLREKNWAKSRGKKRRRGKCRPPNKVEIKKKKAGGRGGGGGSKKGPTTSALSRTRKKLEEGGKKGPVKAGGRGADGDVRNFPSAVIRTVFFLVERGRRRGQSGCFCCRL
jgi:hypothetical protein